jgi:starch synthase
MYEYDQHVAGSAGAATIDTCDPGAVDARSSTLTPRVTLPRRKQVALQPARRPGAKVLFVASEVHPLSRTGGLADVAGSLPKALARTGLDVAIATPLYSRLIPNDVKRRRLAEFRGGDRPLDGPWSLSRADLDGGIPVYLVEREDLFGREHVYGNGTGDYPDNPERFAFFSRAVLEGLKAINWRPDVIHCNDWQSGLLPLYLRTLAKKDRFFEGIRTLFTVHNMAFSGICPAEKLPSLGLADCDPQTTDGLEFYGQLSLLKSGLVFSDRVTTVSPGYCREIQSPEHGCGLDGVLRARQGHVSGILNGVDYDLWNPAMDRALAAKYSADDPTGKAVNKLVFQASENLEMSSAPLAAIVSRLTDQKGLDLVVEGIEGLLDLPLRLVVMGEGDRKHVEALTRMAARFPDRVRVHPRFNLDAAKRVYAASDIYLMPSRFEPCGLSDLIGMRYGAVPVVRRTGGLADAVREFDSATGTGNGFLFSDYSAAALVEAAARAVAAHRNPVQWARVRHNGMNEDFSWRRSVRSYSVLYQSLAAV